MYDLEPKNLIQCTGRVLYKRYNADEGTLFFMLGLFISTVLLFQEKLSGCIKTRKNVIVFI